MNLNKIEKNPPYRYRKAKASFPFVERGAKNLPDQRWEG